MSYFYLFLLPQRPYAYWFFGLTSRGTRRVLLLILTFRDKGVGFGG